MAMRPKKPVKPGISYASQRNHPRGEMEEEEAPLVGGTLLNRLQFEAEKVSAKRKSTLLIPVLKPTNIDPGARLLKRTRPVIRNTWRFTRP